VLLTTEAYKPRFSYAASYLSIGINARLAHEIAHQWFGHQAWPTTERDTWLNESFAEYVSGLAMGAIRPKGVQKIYGFEEMVTGWKDQARQSEDYGSVLGAEQLAGNEAGYYRFGLLYNRGPLILHMLRSLVGDAQFEEMLRRFLAKADGGPATTEDFRQAVREVRGVDMAWLFEDWIARGGIPNVHYAYRTGRTDAGWRLSVELEQDPTTFRKIVVPVLLDFPGGEQAVRMAMQTEPKQSFAFDLPAEPERVRVDPNENNLARYSKK
jgi:aminopeptidase N